ncbi:MAG TPA: hypothetical protein PLX25_03505 [Sphaerochaeta sp.]|jgi:hypothetical protein|nr:hypothetical protein [Sphaerochaeta sp.]HPZ15710.1 hypothetical protein [Sphaerochaeta sp.]
MEHEWYESGYSHDYRRPSGARRLVLLALVVALIACAMLPLSQRAINRSLVLEYRSLQQSYNARAEQQRLLKASISSLGMPESLIDGAWRQEIELIPITGQSVYSVARTSQ